MIKCETIGMLDVAKINPVLTSVNNVTNNSFITVDDVTYLVANDISGDDAYVDGVVIEAGKYLNGYDLSAWVNQNLVADEKHIAYGSGEDYDDITAGTTLLTIDANGKLEIAANAPQSGFYFKVVAKTVLTEKAVKIKIMVV